MNKLSTNFYLHHNVVRIAKSLIGKILCTNIASKFTSAMIVETEAYKAPEDKASHAYNNRKTKRTIPFYQKGGIAYVYLIYGTYHLFNVITNVANSPHAVLIRAAEPIDGLKVMRKRHQNRCKSKKITSGPGLLTIALGINISHNLTDLQGDKIWIEDANPSYTLKDINQTPRIGMNIPEPWKSIPWRFFLKDNKFVSRK